MLVLHSGTLTLLHNGPKAVMLVTGHAKEKSEMLSSGENVYMYRKKNPKTPESIGFSTVCGGRHPLGVLGHIPTDGGTTVTKKEGAINRCPTVEISEVCNCYCGCGSHFLLIHIHSS